MDLTNNNKHKMTMQIPQRKTTMPPSDEAQLVEMGLSPVPKQEIAIPVAHVKTLQDSRDESIMKLLEKAYENSSNLKLSEQEQTALLADFPDADFQRGAGGDNELIYLEHSAIRTRLSKVLGLGQWKAVIRRSWEEEFTTKAKPNEQPSVNKRIYIDMVLIVRGCVVAEAIGCGVYMPKNPRDTYGDGFEKAKTNALRLCCKEWNIGIQAWSKDFCNNWKNKYPGFERPTR